METDPTGRRFADDDRRRGQARYRQNEAARQDEPPANSRRAQQPQRAQTARKPADILRAAADWRCARRRYQQSRANSQNESIE